VPSQLHEALLLLFRNRPTLAPELLRDTLRLDLPPYTDVRIESAELTDVQPAEYRADLVVLLLDGIPVLGIVIEVQLSPDGRKRFVWPAYVANLRARHELPVVLLVVTVDESIARWAAKPIELGGGNRPRQRRFRPWTQPSTSTRANSPDVTTRKARRRGTSKAEPTCSRVSSHFASALPPEAEARIAEAPIDELDAIGERLLTAQTLQEALARADPGAACVRLAGVHATPRALRRWPKGPQRRPPRPRPP
jgi:hypothetical protein